MSNPNQLPHVDHASLITAGELAKLLARKGIITEDEFGWLVTVAYCLPRIELMNEDTWEGIKVDLLAFLRNNPATDKASLGTSSPANAST